MRGKSIVLCQVSGVDNLGLTYKRRVVSSREAFAQLNGVQSSEARQVVGQAQMSGIIINHNFKALKLQEQTHLLKGAMCSNLVPGITYCDIPSSHECK